jgi:hypothetical protein
MVSVQQLQSRSIEIITKLRENHYPSFEIVVQILLDKYGFQHWSQFEVGSFENVPVLQYLFQFNQKVPQIIVFLNCFYVLQVANFIENSLATKLIVTVADLSRELTDFLNYFSFPRLDMFIQAKRLDISSDPNELNFEEECETTVEVKPVTFEDFGIGKLVYHPSLRRFFNENQLSRITLSYSSFPSSLQVLSHLNEYLLLNNNSSLSFQPANPCSFESFHQYLVHVLQLNSLQDQGIILNPNNFHREISELSFEFSYIRRKDNEEKQQWVNEVIKQNQKQIRSSSSSSFRPQRTNESAVLQVPTVKVKIPEDNEKISSFIHDCQEFSNSNFSLTMNKIDQFLSHYDCQSSSPSKRQKIKQNQTFHFKENETPEVFQEIVREYLFLTCGKTSKLQKKFDINFDVDGGSNLDSIPEEENCSSPREMTEADDDQNDLSLELLPPTPPPAPPRVADPSRLVIDTDIFSTRENSISDSTNSCQPPSINLNNIQETPLIYSTFGVPSGAFITNAGSENVTPQEATKKATQPVPIENTVDQPVSNQQSNNNKPRDYTLSFTPNLQAIPNSELIEMIDNQQIRSVLPHDHLLFTPGNQINSMNVNEDTGQWGERFAFYYLSQVFPTTTTTQTTDKMISRKYSIEWINEKEETNSFYDIMVKERQFSSNSSNQQSQGLSFAEKSYFLEVKTTKFDERKNVFQISWNEFQFAMKEPKVPYYIIRIYNAKDYEKIHMVILKDIRQLVEMGRIQLCIAV